MAGHHSLHPFPTVVSCRATAMGLAIAAMLWTDSVHPPGGKLENGGRRLRFLACNQ